MQKVLITAATAMEWAPCYEKRNQFADQFNNNFEFNFQATGVGLLSSAVRLTHLIHQYKPSLVIQAGIAGCFDSNLALGTVVAVKEEAVGDMGVWEDDRWKDIFDLKLQQPDDFPYQQKMLVNTGLADYNLLNLSVVRGTTINEISTTEKRIQILGNRHGAVIESMEGAALHYAGLLSAIPFIQIRAISNYAGERDKSKWLLKESIQQLNSTLEAYLVALNDQYLLLNKK